MTFVVADRVQENGTVASGTGSVTLAGAVNGYQSFASGIGNNNTTYYTIYDPVSYAWEVGLGTVTTSPNTLARTTVYANSSGTQPSKISFSTSDTLTVFVTYPAEIAIYTAASASLNSLSLTSSITGSSNKGALNYGTLSYSDTNIFESYQTSVNSYAQIVIQNSNAGSAASADVVVSSDSGTATTNYGDFGINSTGYTGTGPLNSPSMVYLYSQSYDLTIGTNTSNAIHFTINNAATDAMTINTSGSIAINGQTGSLGQVLISQGSSTPPSWGNAGGNLVVTDFTATAGQTTFTLTYVVGTVSVYRNGIKLGLADFTATNGTSVVLATGAVVGDLIEIQSFTTLTLYSSITSQDFSGNGSTTAFTMSTNPANSASVLVAINGVVQDPANYTVSGNTLTFTTAPATGTNNISCRYLGVPSTTSVSSFSAGTTGFSPTSAASGAVTLSGTLVVANGGTGLTTLTSGYIPYGAGTAALNSSSTFTFDGSTLFSPNASHSGNLTFTGTGAKILGDFTNATVTNRLSFQTSTANSTTGIYALPSGTSTAASWQATNAADPTNAAKILIATNGSTDVQLVSGINGSGTYLPLSFYTAGSQQMRLDTSGNLGVGVNPTSWGAAYSLKAIQVGPVGAFMSLDAGGGNQQTHVLGNSYYNGGFKYITTAAASSYGQTSGDHYFNSSPSGTAGTTLTQTTVLYLALNKTAALQGASSSSGTGIAFPATQSASSDANTLDDYEEGTFTPTLGGSGNTYTATYGGTYTKVGNLVTVMIQASWSAKSGTSGVSIALPFSVSGLRGGFSIGMITNSSIISASQIVYAQVDGGIQTINMRYSNNSATWTSFTPANMGTSGEFQIAGSYFTS